MKIYHPRYWMAWILCLRVWSKLTWPLRRKCACEPSNVVVYGYPMRCPECEKAVAP